MPTVSSPDALRRSPLHDQHVAAGASFTDFAGWNMPVRYQSDLAEHHAVRTAAGIFDLSHMAEFRVSGPEAVDLLHRGLAGAFGTLAVGRAKYSLILNEDGGVIDDVVVYRTGEHEYLVVANASNREPVASVLLPLSRDASQAHDETDSTALVAIQGPRAASLLQSIAGLRPVGDESFDNLGYYRCAAGVFNNAPALVARTGYTGEDGFEVYVPVEHAAELWNQALAAGAPLDAVPCGLACRDTLRLEAGMPLYGHELDSTIRPSQAGLGRVVRTELAETVAADETARVLVGLRGEGRRAARAGYEVYADTTDGPDGAEAIGFVTSGALSPTLGYPIAMAYLDSRHADLGTTVFVDVRGNRIPVTVCELPFYRREKDNS